MRRNLLLPAGILSVLSAMLLLASVAQSAVATSAETAKPSAYMNLRSFTFFRRRRTPVPPPLPVTAPVAPNPRVPAILPVFLAPDILPHHRQIANDIYTLFPERCRSVLTNFYVRYGPQDRRGYAGAHTAIISGEVPDAEFRALAGHEFGHVMDLGCLTGGEESGPSAFRDGSEIIHADDPSAAFYAISWTTAKTMRSGARAEDFISGYAKSDPFEDAAEMIAAMIFQPDMVRARARKNAAIARKARWVETNIFPDGVKVATGGDQWNGKDVPWDVTKLSYQWIGSERVAVK